MFPLYVISSYDQPECLTKGKKNTFLMIETLHYQAGFVIEYVFDTCISDIVVSKMFNKTETFWSKENIAIKITTAVPLTYSYVT